MPEDDPTGDEVPLGPPLPPEDRLWRHPSEVAWPPPPRPATSSAAGPRLWGVALTSGLTGAVLALGVVAVVSGLGGDVTERIVERVPVDDEVASFAARPEGVPAVAAAVSPSVVRLDVRTGAGTTTTGSGVVVRDDGTIITNAHVVAGAIDITVVGADGADVAAEVVGSDSLTDVAVVRAADEATRPWTPAVLGDGGRLEVGETAIAIGSPLGLVGDPSVTVGVVSGLGRRVTADGTVLHGLIQTDAPIARGSSGGALCDGSGVVVGITTALSMSEGMGFAIPIEDARAVADDLLRHGEVRWAWLGIEGADADGVRVIGVAAGGPAAAAGVAVGDVITAIDGDPVRSMSGLVVALRSIEPGEEVGLEVRRGSETLALDVTLAERPG